MDTLEPRFWQIRAGTLSIDRPLVMGIVNVTPDSFSDGGRWFDASAAVDHGLCLVAEGADILDIGGESTRPGAEPVPEDEELRRVVSVVAALVKQTVKPISIDTMKPAVAQACLDAGAHIVNDVTGLADPRMVKAVRESQAGAIAMHMQGTPKTMQLDPRYKDVVMDVGEYFRSRLRILQDSGLDPLALAIDPGIGFGKRTEHNWRLIARLSAFQSMNRPLVLGVSRKGFLGKDRPSEQRIAAGLAIACHCAANGSAQIIRTHDVAETVSALNAIQEIRRHTT